MNETAVSPAEIDRFLAEQCKDAIPTWWDNDTYRWNYEASFTTSLDALFAPGGPVEKCREQGFSLAVLSGPYAEGWQADMMALPGLSHKVESAATPALALATACYQALSSQVPTTP